MASERGFAALSMGPYSTASIGSATCPASQDCQRPLFVGDLDLKMDEAHLFKVFSKAGPVKRVRVFRHLKESPNYALIEFVQQHDAVKLYGDHCSGMPFVDENGHHFSTMSFNSYDMPGKHGKYDDEHSLFVGNLDVEATEIQVLSLFAERYSSVVEVRIVNDPRGRPKGYAFVTFGDASEAERAFSQMQGTKVGGRKIKIRHTNRKDGGEFAESKPQAADDRQTLTTSQPQHTHAAIEMRHSQVALAAKAGFNFQPAAKQEYIYCDAPTWMTQNATGAVPTGYTGHVLCLSGVSWSVTEGDLLAHFSTFGHVLRAYRTGKETANIEFQSRLSLDAAAVQTAQAGAGCNLPFQIAGMDADSCGQFTKQAPRITNMTTHQAQSQLEGKMQGPVFNDHAIPHAAQAWVQGLFGGSQGVSLPPALAQFQAMIQNPVFAQAFEDHLSRDVAMMETDSAEDSAADRQSHGEHPSWLLQDHPALFTGLSCGEHMNEDYAPRCDSPRRCLDSRVASTPLIRAMDFTDGSEWFQRSAMEV